MNLLLLFFALPIAVIIVSIALQKILKCQFLVASIIFAIFLVVTFVIGNLIYLVATIAYTILSFITAVLTKIICRILRELDRREGNNDNCCGRSNNTRNTNNGTQLLSITGNCSNNDGGNGKNLLTISSNGCGETENELLTINSSYGTNNNSDSGRCSCNCNTSNDSIAVRANVFPNNNTNGRTGNFCGCYRRR